MERGAPAKGGVEAHGGAPAVNLLPSPSTGQAKNVGCVPRTHRSKTFPDSMEKIKMLVNSGRPEIMCQ